MRAAWRRETASLEEHARLPGRDAAIGDTSVPDPVMAGWDGKQSRIGGETCLHCGFEHHEVMRLRYFIVSRVNDACCIVDDVAYRPTVVLLTRALPRWWRCELGRLSMWLDDRWATGVWTGSEAPCPPGGLCRACGRRAAWLVVGWQPELDEEPPDPDWYLGSHPVEICGWCNLGEEPIDGEKDLQRALTAARAHSVSWRWR